MRMALPAALILVLAPVPALLAGDDGAPPAEPEEKVYTMPDFRVESLDGQVLDSLEMRGNVVLIDLWATWCGPCLTATPALDKIYEDFKDRGLLMMGIAVDSGTEEQVRKAAAKFGMSYPVALWNEHLAERIQGLQAVPTYIIVKPDWTIHKLFVGATSPLVLRRNIEELLGGASAQAPSR